MTADEKIKITELLEELYYKYDQGHSKFAEDMQSTLNGIDAIMNARDTLASETKRQHFREFCESAKKKWLVIDFDSNSTLTDYSHPSGELHLDESYDSIDKLIDFVIDGN